MEWTESIRRAIGYMETHILEDITVEEVAESVHISPFYLQRGFKIMTGYTIGEYMRCRRLYLAALDIFSGKEKVIDLAYKYGYETPESFTKAFTRFHGVSPIRMKDDTRRIRTFLPLKISVVIQGGNDMDYVVEEMKEFQVIGFAREFSFENSYQEIPKFWDEVAEKYGNLMSGKCAPENETEQAICDCMIGEYGLCIDDIGVEGKFRYLIAGEYKGGPVPEGMTIYEFPDMKWAKFRCCGSMPGALQSVNTKIFKEWLPGNPEYRIAMGANLEWYSQGDMTAPDYESAIWLPVVEK